MNQTGLVLQRLWCNRLHWEGKTPTPFDISSCCNKQILSSDAVDLLSSYQVVYGSREPMKRLHYRRPTLPWANPHTVKFTPPCVSVSVAIKHSKQTLAGNTLTLQRLMFTLTWQLRQILWRDVISARASLSRFFPHRVRLMQHMLHSSHRRVVLQ